jgi:hypothetical protein
MFNQTEIAALLNKLPRYSLEDTCRGHYQSDNQLVEQDRRFDAEWLKIEDVAKLFGLRFGYYHDKEYTVMDHRFHEVNG